MQTEITLKEVYERMVALEVKYDLKMTDDRKTQRRFTKYVVYLLLLILTNIFISLSVLNLHIKLVQIGDLWHGIK